MTSAWLGAASVRMGAAGQARNGSSRPGKARMVTASQDEAGQAGHVAVGPGRSQVGAAFLGSHGIAGLDPAAARLGAVRLSKDGFGEAGAVLSGLVTATHGAAWQARHGLSRCGTARHGTAGADWRFKAGRVSARQDMAGTAALDTERLVLAWRGRHGTSLNSTKPRLQPGSVSNSTQPER